MTVNVGIAFHTGYSVTSAVIVIFEPTVMMSVPAAVLLHPLNAKPSFASGTCDTVASSPL